jgi:hypothetical protein
LIAQYNSAVDNWNSQYQAEFKLAPGFQFASQVNSPSYSAASYVSGSFYTSTSSDSLNDYAHSGETFKSYTPFKFVSASPQSAVTRTVYLNYSFTYLVYDAYNNLLFHDSTWMPYKDLVAGVSCSTSEIKKYGSNYACLQAKCSQLSGQHNFQATDYTCHYQMYPQKVCVKMSKSAAASWTVQTGSWSGDIGGCYGTSGTTQMTSINPGYVLAEVRHYKDPYVIAGQLTNGSMNFGLTQGENARLGLIFLIIGGIITTLVILCVVGTMRCVRDWWEGRSGYKQVGSQEPYVVVQPQPVAQPQPQYVQPGYGYNPNPPQGYYAPTAPPAPGYYNQNPPQGYAYQHATAPPAPYN